MGLSRDTHFALQGGTNPQNKQFGVREIRTELIGPVDVCTTVSFPKLSPEMYIVNILRDKKKNTRLLQFY